MRRIILDTDLSMGEPGSEIDDGFALALALADPGLSVDLVTTVNGNTDVDTATALTIELLDRLGRAQVPVVRGAERPLVRPVFDEAAAAARAQASRARPSWSRARPGMAADAIVDAVTAAPGELTVVAIGPLTNVALALARDPSIAAGLREVVAMGGVFQGTTNQLDMPGEFNTWVDPDATAAVLASGVPLRFVGLDVTLQVRLSRADAQQMGGRSGAGTDSGDRGFGRFAGDCTLAWIDALEASGAAAGAGGDGGADPGSCALHDPLAVAVLTRAELVTWRSARVAVETVGDVARGVTVADFRSSAGAPNCRVGVAVDAVAFRHVFLQRMASL